MMLKTKKTAHRWDYGRICSFFGPESDGPWTRCNGKQDEDMNRKRMADWQEEYQVSLNGMDVNVSEGAGNPQVGDWVVLSTFCRGTGQSLVGASTMRNGIFALNYFNADGTKALTDYWEQMFAMDPELPMLMMANPGNYFEDSIELTSVSSYWASSFLDNMPDGYPYTDILPTVAASKYISSGFMGVTVTDYFSFTGDSKVTDVDFGMQALGKWCDMQVTSEQLDMLGVSDMKYVSGTGEYTITFTLPDDFGDNDGAFISYSYGRDQVGALIVNGTELPANNASDRVDAGSLLTAGLNTLTIRLNTTMYGRTYYEHSGYLDRGVVYGMGEGVMDQPVPETYYNGLLSVSIIPYIAKAMDTPSAIRHVPATDNQPASSSAPIYNLKGQRLGTPQRGVNIIGGDKSHFRVNSRVSAWKKNQSSSPDSEEELCLHLPEALSVHGGKDR